MKQKVIIFAWTALFVACTEIHEQPAVPNELSSGKSTGIMYNEKPVLVKTDNGYAPADEAYLQRYFEQALGYLEPDSEGQLTSLQGYTVALSQPDEQGATGLYLHAKTADGTIEVAAFLDETGDGYVMRTGQKTCKCEGCSNGCALVVSGHNCYCSSCPHNDPSCKKTETATVEY